MARRLPTKARLEINVHNVISEAVREGAAHAARQILESDLDHAAMVDLIENEVLIALDGVVLWPN